GVLPGSIIRIDPLQDGDQPYTVPGDNPFVGEAGVLPEIWAYGLRHPQYFAWDTGGDGKMIIGEIGENQVEQLELGVAGANYGWGEREGTFVIDRDNHEIIYELPPWDELRGFTYPVLQYDHDEGDAIATGYVYRGDSIPQLQGKYIFGDLSNGRIFYVDIDDLVAGQTVTEFNELRLRYNGVERSLTDIIGQRLGTPTERAELRFGQDEDGEVYILSKWDGMVRKLVPAESLTVANVLDDDGGVLDDVSEPSGSGGTVAPLVSSSGAVGTGLDDLLGSSIAYA
ncbi:MAG TPA: PQQ-dependent sugar dehydrogenase, partial [Geminicoccaceae bacterium]|nr:PQQ-dependent sugar dehydrogenase [Geminicoccaceae bacterium]